MLRGLLLLLNMTGVPRLVFRLMMDRRVPMRLKLLLPAALVYLVLPMDIVPDILPALGRIDDILVILLSLLLFLGMAPRDVVWEHLRRGRASPSKDEGDTKANQRVIDGKYRVIDDEEPRR